MAPAAPTPLPSPPPITDRIALGALTSTFPPDLVDRVVQQTGRAEQRRRLLPARGEGVGAFPQVRVVGLVEAGTHAIVDAVQGPYSSGEQTLARHLARDGGRLGPGVLLLADRLFVGAELWRQMARTGADLVWRVKCGSKTAPKLPVDQVLSDGSWLSRLYAGTDRRKRHPITV